MLKILSLDGGPGPLMELRVIERLEARCLKKNISFLEQTDLFAGTSDGGLMALFFAKELTLRKRALRENKPAKSTMQIIEECEAFSNRYAGALAAHTQRIAKLILPLGAARELALEIKSSKKMRRNVMTQLIKRLATIPGSVAGAAGDVWRIRRTIMGLQPLAPDKEFKAIMEEAFGDWTLKDLEKHVVVLTFDTTAWKPRAYRNFGASDPDGQKDLARDANVSLAEVAMSTAAMPLFLPVYGGTENRGYLDGIFSANNPCTSAVTLALRHLCENVQGNPLDHMLLLSMGVMQSTEEANIEHTGGILSLLDLLTVDDVHTRMTHSVPTGELPSYFSDMATRLEVFRNPQRKGIGERHWGWIEYLRRPTFIANMLIHGMNGEASAQTSRMLRGRFFRHAPRVCLARVLFRTVMLGEKIEDTELPEDARRCFREGTKTLDRDITADEEKNVRDTDLLLAWLDEAWLKQSIDEVDEEAGNAAKDVAESFPVTDTGPIQRAPRSETPPPQSAPDVDPAWQDTPEEESVGFSQ